MNQTDVTKMLSMLTSVWSGEVIDDQKIRGYTLALAAFPAELVMEAAAKHMQRSRFWPYPADLVALVVETIPLPSTGEAWESVQRLIRAYGYDAGWRELGELEPTIQRAVQAVGWRRLCYDDNTQGYIRRDFDKAYENARDRSIRELQTGNLVLGLPGGKAPALTGGQS